MKQIVRGRRIQYLIITLTTLALYGCVQSATLQPTNTPIPGWKKFEGGGIEISLPDRYVGGNVSENYEEIAKNLRERGPEWEKIAQSIEQNPESIVISAIDPNAGPSGYLTNMAVTKEELSVDVTIETYQDIVAKQLPPQVQLVEENIVSIGEYEAGRWVIEIENSGKVNKQLLYNIKDGNTIWSIAYSTRKDEFTDRLPEFEQSVNTYYIIPK